MFSVFADSYFTKLEVSQVSPKRVLQDITSSVMENSSSHPSPASSYSSVHTVEVIAASKRKRQEDDENEPNKRRSEEPLFKIVHKLVDETETDLDEEESDNKENEEKKTDDAETDVKEEEKEVIESKYDKEEEDEEPEWEVEEIVDYKYNKKKKTGMYLVKWVGWHSNSNTWEPEEHLAGTDILAEFNNRRLEKQEEVKEPEPEWEVEEIVDYQWCRDQMAGLYLVKWVGWGSESNTWEPEANLQCTDLLTEFYKTRLREREGATPAEMRALELPPDPRETFQIRTDFLREHCPPASRKKLEKLFSENIVKPWHKRARKLPEKVINAEVDSCARKMSATKLKWIQEQLAIKSMILAREAQLQDLKKYEEEINEIDPSARVSVINEVDLEGPPRQMQYINAYKAGAGIPIPEDPPIGCRCETCDWKQKECCSKTAGGFHFAYKSQGRLRDVIDVSQSNIFMSYQTEIFSYS